MGTEVLAPVDTAVDSVERTPLPVERTPLPVSPVSPTTPNEDSPIIIAYLHNSGNKVNGENIKAVQRLIDQHGSRAVFDEYARTYLHSQDAKAGADIAKRMEALVQAGPFDLERDLGQQVEEAKKYWMPENETQVTAGVMAGGNQDSPKAALDALKLENTNDSGWLSNAGGSLVNAFMRGVPSAVAAYRYSQKFNLDLGLWSISPEAVGQAMGQKYVETPEAGKARFIMDALEFSKETSGVAFDDTALELRKYINNPELLDTLSDPQKTELVKSIGMQVFDVVAMGSPRWTLAGARSLGKIIGLNKTLGQEVANAALKGEVAGIAPTDAAIDFVPKPLLPEEFIGEEQITTPVAEALSEETSRASSIQIEAMDATNRLLRQGITPDMEDAAGKLAMEETSRELNGLQLVSQIRLEGAQDGLSVSAQTTIGADSTGAGFNGTKALEVAKNLHAKGFSTRIRNITTGEILPLDELTIEETLATRQASRLTRKPLPAGAKLPDKYYVEVSKELSYSAIERAALGKDIVNGWSWLKGLTNYIGIPTAWMKRSVYEAYYTAWAGQRRLTGVLQAALAPIRKLSVDVQGELNNMAVFAQEFGEKTGMNPTLTDLRAKFGGTLTDELKVAFFQLRQVSDAAYEAANKRVYEILGKERARSIINRKSGASYSGTPLEVDAAKKEVGSVFDPQSKTIFKMDSKAIDDLYARGGQILRSPFEEEVLLDKSQYVLYDPVKASEWSIQRLTKFPLTKLPGYYTNIYENRTFVYEEVLNGEVNGVRTNYSTPVGVGGSREEAQRIIDEVLKPKNPLKHYTIELPPTTSQIEATLWSALRHDPSTGLIYGDRGKRLVGIGGKAATLVDPINAAIKLGNVLSRSIGTEMLTGRMIQGFKNEFSDVIRLIEHPPGKNITLSFDRLTGTQVSNALSSIGGSRAEKARVMWDYIRQQAGLTTRDPSWFRHRMHDMSQGFYNFAEAKGWSNVSKIGRDKLMGGDILQVGRTAAFWDYIQLNPVGQVALQGLQPTFIAVLATIGGKYPLNYFRVFVEANALGQSAKWRAIELLGGKKVSEELWERNAKIWGMKVNEYKELVKQYDRFGMRAGIDPRSMTGDFTTHTGHLATTRVGKFLQSITHTGIKVPVLGDVTLARAGNFVTSGFDKGEAGNVNTSFATAFHVYTNGSRTTKGLVEADWLKLNAKAGDFAGGMNGANKADWQINTFSASLMQFFQYGHKGLLTMTFSNRGAFTNKQAAAIILNQLMLWGTDGIPFFPAVSKEMAKLGVVDPKDLDSIHTGVLELGLNTLITELSGEESNLNFSARLAPMAGMANSMAELYSFAFTTPVDWITNIPSGRTTIGIYQGVQAMWDIVRFTDKGDPWDDQTFIEASKALLSAGAAGVSNYRQGQLMHQYGAYPTRDGRLLGVKANTIEAYAKGILGINSQEYTDYYELLDDIGTKAHPPQAIIFKSAQEDAANYYSRIQRTLTAVGKGEDTLAHALLTLRTEQRYYHDSDNTYNEAFREALDARNTASKPRGEDIGTLLYKAQEGGAELSEWHKLRLARSKSTDPAVKAAVLASMDAIEGEMKRAAEINRIEIDRGIKELETDMRRNKND